MSKVICDKMRTCDQSDVCGAASPHDYIENECDSCVFDDCAQCVEIETESGYPPIPCETCITRAICKGIIVDGIDKMKTYHEVIDYAKRLSDVSVTHLTETLDQEVVNNLLNGLMRKCSILQTYLRSGRIVKRYWYVREFYKLNEKY